LTRLCDDEEYFFRRDRQVGSFSHWEILAH
jgi:hypothetical protein